LPPRACNVRFTSRLCKNFRAFHTSLFRSLLRGLRAFRVEKIAKNLALLDRLQNVAKLLHGLDPTRTLKREDRRGRSRLIAAIRSVCFRAPGSRHRVMTGVGSSASARNRISRPISKAPRGRVGTGRLPPPLVARRRLTPSSGRAFRAQPKACGTSRVNRGRKGSLWQPPEKGFSRRLCAIPRDNLLGQIDEGAQARGHVAAAWIIQAISRIPGRPLA
jgi:hypothetical protein